MKNYNDTSWERTSDLTTVGKQYEFENYNFVCSFNQFSRLSDQICNTLATEPISLCRSAGTKLIKVKVKVTLEQPAKAQRGMEVQLYSFFNLCARWVMWSTPRLGRFTPTKDPAPIVQEAAQGPGPVWTSAENLAPNGIRSPDRSTHSEWL